jgi:hypothetical protein
LAFDLNQAVRKLFDVNCNRALRDFAPDPKGAAPAAMKPFTTIAVVVFTIKAVVHLFRVVAGWEIVVTGFAIPVWWSLPGGVIFAGLAVMLWREARVKNQ